MNTYPKKLFVFGLFCAFSLVGIASAASQNSEPESELKTIIINYGNQYYRVIYKPDRPDDVPHEVYDALWEVQKEVVDNFTYDYSVLRDSRKYRDLSTKEDFYKHGKGVCENYANFFILLASEKGIMENLYKISGDRRGGGHAWLEYRTEHNVYIIDPTWSDDYSYDSSARKKFRESPAYGKKAFFITYEEDAVIFSLKRHGYNHSSYRNRVEVPLWRREE